MSDDGSRRGTGRWRPPVIVARGKPAQRSRRLGKIARQVLSGDIAVIDGLDLAALIVFDAAALAHPFDAGRA